MKSSVGVTICAVFVLIGSALGLLAAGGIAFVAAGPLSRQFFDPANLPPGADVRLMRGAMLSGAFFTGAFAAFGIATGIGLIRLWKWARYAAIVIGVIVVVLTVLPGIAFLFVPLPPPTSGAAGPMPSAFRWVLSGFYFFWSILGGIFVYVMARKSTAAQFNGEDAAPSVPTRPLSVSIIAWFMIVSAAMGLPMVAFARLPASVLGLMLMGGWAKAFFIIYFSLYVLIGLGLLKRTSEAIMPAIGLHAFALLNALTLLVPSVWLRMEATMRSTPMFGVEPDPASMVPARYFAVASGVIMPAIIIFFLLRARRSLPPPAND